MMCKDHYTISVTPKIMERLINHLIDTAWFFRVNKREKHAVRHELEQVSSPLCKTYPFSSTRQKLSWRVSIQTSKLGNVYVSSVTALHGCQDVFRMTWSCWVFTVLHRSLWVTTVKHGIWTRLEIAETLCHLDMETNKSMLPSGEDKGNFWCFTFQTMKCRWNVTWTGG